jgi:hypothetical protein
VIMRMTMNRYAPILSTIGFVLMLMAVVVLYAGLRSSNATHALAGADRARLHADLELTRRAMDEAIRAGREDRRKILEAIDRALDSGRADRRAILDAVRRVEEGPGGEPGPTPDGEARP